jgi:hypothetical protein
MMKNLANSGPDSLRAAIQAANTAVGADVIRFAPGQSGTLHLAGSTLVVIDNLTIDGPGANRLTVSGDNAGRVFVVNGNTTSVEIGDLTIANGFATGSVLVLGGGVLNNGGHLTLRRTTLTGNMVSAPSQGSLAAGGAIGSTGSTASLNLDGVTFLANRAEGFLTAGGAVADVFGATAHVTNSTFSNNQSSGLFLSVARAVYVDGAAALNVEHSRFSANQAVATLGSALIGNLVQGVGGGGAIASGGGSHLRVSHSSFAGNLARAGNGGQGQDGHRRRCLQHEQQPARADHHRRHPDRGTQLVHRQPGSWRQRR